MPHTKHLNSKLEGSPFNLEFPEASSTPKTNVTYLNEDIFKKKLNKEDFKAKLIKERSFRVYYKKSALGTAAESYCALVRTKNGIPAQYVLMLDKGNKKRVVYTAAGPQGQIIYACETFNPFWEYLLSTLEELPENYEAVYTLIDSKWAQFQKDAKTKAASQQTATSKTASTQSGTPTQPVTKLKPASEATPTSKQESTAKPTTPTREACACSNKIPLIPMPYRSKPEYLNSLDHDE